MQKNHTGFLRFVAVALVLAGCASPAKKNDSSNLDQLERDGKLEAVFDQLAAEKPGIISLPSSSKGRQEQLALIGGRLAAKESSRLKDELEVPRLEDGHVPLAWLETLRPRGDRLKRWNEESYRRWGQLVDGEIAKTKAAIGRERAGANALPANDVKGRIAALERTAVLGGGGSAEESAAKQGVADAKQEAYAEGLKAFQEKQFDAAEKTFALLSDADPVYRDVGKQLQLVRLASVQKEYRDPKNEESIEAAFQRLIALAGSGGWKAIEPEARGMLPEIRGHYQSLAAAALAEERLADAFKAVTRARSVRRLGQDNEPLLEEAALVEKVREAREAAVRANHNGLALGYLMVIEELQPDFPQLKKMLRETRERAYEDSLKRVGTSRFTSSEGSARLGAAVASKVAQALFRQLPHDIRLIERDQLEAVLREQEILAMQNKSALNIAATDFLVQGAIVEATVEIDEKKGRKVMRVKTSERSEPNPEFKAWLALSPADRAKTSKPNEFIVHPVMEDITINVSTHRKKGSLSVAFKLVDSATANVLLTQNESFRTMAESESSDAVQLGDYALPMRVAELPSDGELFETLVDQAAAKIAGVFVDRLRDQDRNYEKLAVRNIQEDNPLMAAERSASAYLIGEKKGRDMSAVTEQLRRLALMVRLGG